MPLRVTQSSSTRNPFATALVAVGIAAWLAGCQSAPIAPQAAPTSAVQPDGAVAPVPPPVDPIAAVVTQATQAHAAGGVCDMPAGPATAFRFKGGRYELASGGACAKAGHTRVWVDKRHIEIADAAYAPLLTRLRETPGLVLDIAYASDRIFCDASDCKVPEPLYGKARCYLNPQAADRLRAAAASLHARDPSLRLRVLDCYRPVNVQIEMFERVSNPEWVAAPKAPRYGGHNRGIAMDVTIERDGVALDMGSAFDLFTDISNYDAKGLSIEATANRKLLRDLMVTQGLRPYDGEWWHFSLPIDTRAMDFAL